MSEKFDEFLEEVVKDIRQEKLLNLWKQYGKQIIGGVVGIVIFIAGYNFWGHYEQNKRIQMAEKLIAAQNYIAQGEADKALVLLNNLSSESGNTYPSLALFQKAGLLLQDGPKTHQTDAITIYRQLSANKKLDPLWRDLATLLSVMVSIDQPESKAEDLLSQISTLTTEKNPWRYLAQEMKGVLLHKKGEKAQAAEVFAKLVQDSHTPAGISIRARLMAQIVSSGVNE